MAKVVLISASPKKEGNTAQLMQECARVIGGLGVEAEVISFAGMKIESCIACGRCLKEGKCGLNDGLNEIVDQIRPAEGLIVGAPVYFGTARGDTMSALQRIGWLSRSSDKFLTGMVGGPSPSPAAAARR